MDRREELSDFLRTRRARVQPESVGLRRQSRGRAPGLRREDVAQLAGVSVDYYTRIEQGRGRNPSPEILIAIGRALNLDEDEQRHLEALALSESRPARAPQRGGERVRPGVQRLLDAFSATTPAFVLGRRMDVIAWNPLAAALITDFGALPAARRNMVRLAFMDPAAREFYRDWEEVARESIAHLRLACGRYPDDAALAALVGELSVKSEDFRRLWSKHDVKQKGFGRKRLHHRSVGELELDYEAFALSDGGGKTLVTYTAEAGSSSEQALQLLGMVGAADAVGI
ncbi:helix-turn-helix domain-containing protein [Kitasatospora sp. NPDC088134]|uniref:helix-turn-helix domain-containing protein n=1 Tax=Kitasatospora sp. NPDC088134 TaxID=3364071 RepID=UPI0037FF130E